MKNKIKKNIWEFFNFKLFISVFLIIFTLPVICYAQKSNDSGGYFKEVNINIDEEFLTKDAFLLKNNRVFFPGVKNSLLFDPEKSSFKKLPGFNRLYQYHINEGFLLENGNLLFISPYRTSPEEKFHSELYSLIKDELIDEQKRIYKHRKREYVSEDSFNFSMAVKALHLYSNLSSEEQKKLWESKLLKQPDLLKKYNNYVDEYEKSMQAQIYNPKTEQFSYIEKAKIRRTATKKVQLKDGRVFIIGGYASPPGDGYFDKISTIELFDPLKNKFEIININEQFEYVYNITLLEDGRILIQFSGKISPESNSSGDLYAYFDIKNNTLSKIKKLNLILSSKRLNLTNGNVLLFTKGKSISEGHLTRHIYNQIKLFNPYTEEITHVSSFAKDRGEGGFDAVEMKDGRVFIFGGDDEKTNNTAEVIDLTKKQSTYIGKMKYRHCRDKGLLLGNGDILIYGRNLELYNSTNK